MHSETDLETLGEDMACPHNLPAMDKSSVHSIKRMLVGTLKWPPFRQVAASSRILPALGQEWRLQVGEEDIL